MTTPQTIDPEVPNDGDPSRAAAWEPAPSRAVLDFPESPPAEEVINPEDGTGVDASSPGTEAPVEEPDAPADIPDALKTPALDPNAALGDAERRELARLRFERGETLQLQAQQRQTAELEQLERHYSEQYNIDSETARFIASEVRAERARGQSQLERAELTRQIEIGRQNASIYYGKQYNVRPEALIRFDTPESMEEHAKLLQHTAKQEKRLVAVEKTRVPEQTFLGGSQPAPASAEGLLAHYGNNPDLEFTPAHRKILIDAGYGV